MLASNRRLRMTVSSRPKPEPNLPLIALGRAWTAGMTISSHRSADGFGVWRCSGERLGVVFVGLGNAHEPVAGAGDGLDVPRLVPIVLKLRP